MEAAFLRSRRVERHQSWNNRMRKKCHAHAIFGQIACACTSACNYICHAILPIWVSFNSSGPKECNLQSRFGLKNYLMWKKLKLIIEIFFLSKFRKYFVYFAKKQQLWGKGKPCPIRLNLFLVVLMTLENGIRFLLTCFETLFYFGQFWDTLIIGCILNLIAQYRWM